MSRRTGSWSRGHSPELYGHRRCVLNGVDPSTLIYSASKDDYLLFVSRAEAAEAKGIDQAIELRAPRVRLVVMASSNERRGDG